MRDTVLMYSAGEHSTHSACIKRSQLSFTRNDTIHGSIGILSQPDLNNNKKRRNATKPGIDMTGLRNERWQ